MLVLKENEGDWGREREIVLSRQSFPGSERAENAETIRQAGIGIVIKYAFFCSVLRRY